MALRTLTPTLAVLAAPAAAQVHFTDQAAAAGVDQATYGRGAAMVDLDQDGRLDLVAANSGMDDHVLRQLPDRTFELANALWGVPSDSRATWGVLAADFDEDGDPDLYLPAGGFFGATQNRVLRNDLGTLGQLTPADAIAGEDDRITQSFGATALDHDRDGDLDVFLSTHGGPCDLLRNEGGLVLTSVGAAAGITEPGKYKHCGAGDYDDDGWPDVAVADYSGPNRLYRNQADGTFVDVAAAAGVAAASAVPAKDFGMVFADLDGDLDLDLYDAKYQLEPTGPSVLYLNQGDGTFVDVSAGSGMTGQDDMGHDVHDVDLDGHPDVYIGTGNPDFLAEDALFLLAPDGTGGLTATDVSDTSGITTVGKTRNHGMAFGDYDEDGDVDVFVNTGGPSWLPDTIERNLLWVNDGNGRAWAAIELEGTLSNRSGVGARATAFTPGGAAVHLLRSAGRGFANTPSPVLRFGLGDETAVERIEVLWPSGVRQTLHAPPTLAVLDVVETGLRVDGAPAAGATVDLVACGPAGDLALVGVSLGTSSVPLPELGGVLGLAAPIAVVADLPLDAEGLASVPAPLPAGPEWVGAALHLQAWVRPPGAVTGGTLTDPVTVVVE